MFAYANFIAYLTTWIAHTLFFLGIIPQIMLNYKLKSTEGLSNLLLIGYLNGYIAYCYYTFCLNLPIVYKVMVPISTATMLILIFQRFLYLSSFVKKEKFFLGLYFLNIFIALALIPIAKNYPIVFGYFFGWLMMFIWATYQIPQIVKVFVEKSVQGFSFGLVSLIGIGDIFECVGGLILGLPIPTLLNDFRGIFIYLLFCIQFWLYKNKNKIVEQQVQPAITALPVIEETVSAVLE